MVAEKPAQPRIFRVSYGSTRRRGAGGRFIPSTAEVYIKVPYAGLYGLVETLVRATTTLQVAWFRIDVAKPGEITPEIRASLKRWTEALPFTTEVTGVQWDR